MPAIHDYLDYRVYLKEQLNEIREQKTCYSYRRIAQKLSIDPGTLVKILQQKRHISKRLIPSFSSFLQLSEHETNFFSCLVHFNKAKNVKKKQLFLEQLLKLKES